MTENEFLPLFYLLYDGPHVIDEYEDDGSAPELARTFIYGSGIDEPIMMIDADTGSRYYYFYDGLGSVAALSNTSGDIVKGYTGACPERSRRNAFGKVKIHMSAGNDGQWLNGDAETQYSLSMSGSVYGNPYMFTGRRLDPETRSSTFCGLYYYRARMYNPHLGRFMQTDPIGYYDSMNLYQYAFNSPTNYLDPLGLSSKGDSTISGVIDIVKEIYNVTQSLRNAPYNLALREATKMYPGEESGTMEENHPIRDIARMSLEGYHTGQYLKYSALAWGSRVTAGYIDQVGDPSKWVTGGGIPDLLGFTPGVREGLIDYSNYGFEQAARHNLAGNYGTLPHNDTIYDVYLDPLGYSYEDIGGDIPSEDEY